MSYIIGLIRNPHDAEDIFQEVWMTLNRAIHNGKSIENVQKWSRFTARNLILHYWRSKRRKGIIVDSEFLDFVDQAYEENDTETELWNKRFIALQVCMKKLNEKMNQLISLKYERGLKFKEIAEITKKSAQSIKMSVSRIRQKLRDCTEKELILKTGHQDG